MSLITATQNKTFLLFFLLFLVSSSSAKVEGFEDRILISPLHKGGSGMTWRKLLVSDAVLDYDYAGPNPKHSPRQGKPGGSSGKNP